MLIEQFLRAFLQMQCGVPNGEKKKETMQGPVPSNMLAEKAIVDIPPSRYMYMQ